MITSFSFHRLHLLKCGFLLWISLSLQGDVERKLSQMILDKKFHGNWYFLFLSKQPSAVSHFTGRASSPSVCCNIFIWHCCRNPRPRWRSLDHIWGATSGQNIRSSLGNNSEHEQSRGLTLQQSQEADIGKKKKKKEKSGGKTWLLCSLLHLDQMCFLSPSEQIATAVRWRNCVCLTSVCNILRRGQGRATKSPTNCNKQDSPIKLPSFLSLNGQFHHFSRLFLFFFLFNFDISSGFCITLSGQIRPSGNIVQPQ